MLSKYCLQTYLYLFQFYSFIWKIFFRILGPIYFVYYIENGSTKNITHYYYLGLYLNRYRNGLFYCKILNKNRIDHITHSGRLDHISRHTLPVEQPYRKRKNITLLNNGKVIHFDLNILDNYVYNMHKINGTILCPKDIFKCLGIKCTDIQFIELIPFKQTIIPIDMINLSNLYETDIV